MPNSKPISPEIPFGNGTPFNPFSSKPLPPAAASQGPKPTPSQPRNGGINVEDLVKRIDAKIAELEEEEKKEKEKTTPAVEQPNTIPSPVISNPTMGAPIVPPQPSSTPTSSPVIEQPKTKPGVSDDQFFDDFFGDD